MGGAAREGLLPRRNCTLAGQKAHYFFQSEKFPGNQGAPFRASLDGAGAHLYTERCSKITQFHTLFAVRHRPQTRPVRQGGSLDFYAA